MNANPREGHRRSIRLPGYDYSQAGAYCVTICSDDRECLFGQVEAGEMVLNPYGRLVELFWRRLPRWFAGLELGPFVVMPNHVHGIIIIGAGGGGEPCADGRRRGEAFGNRCPPYCADSLPNASPLRPAQPPHGTEPNASPLRPAQPPHGTEPGSVGAIVQSLKSVTSRKINRMRQTPGAPVWQRNYYEHIIRDQADADRIARYIADNPMRWEFDEENPA